MLLGRQPLARYPLGRGLAVATSATLAAVENVGAADSSTAFASISISSIDVLTASDLVVSVAEASINEIIHCISESGLSVEGYVVTAEGVASFSLQSSAAPVLTYSLVQQLQLSQATTAQSSSFVVLLEGAVLIDELRFLVLVTVLSDLALTDESVSAIRRTAVLQEAVRLASMTSVQAGMTAALSETVTVQDSLFSVLALLLGETLTLNDQAAASFERVLRAVETARLQSTTAATAELLAALDEVVRVSDALALVVALLADDSALTLLDQTSPAVRRVAEIVEALRLISGTGGQVETAVGAADSVTLLDRLRALFAAAATDTVAFVDQDTLATLRKALSAEQLRVIDSAAGALTLGAELLETLSLEALTALFQQLSATESLALADTLTAAWLTKALAPEVLTVTSSSAPAFTFVALAEDSVVTASSLTGQLQAFVQGSETILFSGRLPLAADDYQVWALNTESLGSSQYTNVGLQDLVSYEGKVFGLGADGIYVLEGDTDAGVSIDWNIDLGYVDFGFLEKNRVPRAYLYVLKTQDVLLKITSEVDGVAQENWYKVKEAGQSPVKTVRMSRTLRASTWQVELTSVDGEDFDLRGAELVVMR